ncbi:MAG: helix-turn-helix domain-containing protein [Bauldia sp.]
MTNKMVEAQAKDAPEKEELKGMAGALLGRSVLDALDDDLRRIGFAGPTGVPKLVLLACMSRCLRRPVSLLIKGASSSGKSYSLNAGLKFVPAQAYEYFAGMSNKALVYAESLDLRHRMLVIGEAAGMEDGSGNPFLRQLLSENQVRYLTVQKSEGEGNVGVEMKGVQGPTGLVMTTTANALHPEDENRMLSVTLDESPETIRQVLRNQALGLDESANVVDYVPYHALHQLVGSEPTDVNIPFASVLADALPTTHNRVQRDFPKVLGLVKAHALLHQWGRSRDAGGRCIASLDDYEVVYGLVAEPLSQGVEASVTETMRDVVGGVAKLTGGRRQSEFPMSVSDMDTAGPISQRTLAAELRRDPSVVSRTVSKAVELGYLENLNPGQGREARLQLGKRDLPQGTVLPHPDELRKAMKEQNAGKLVRPTPSLVA